MALQYLHSRFLLMLIFLFAINIFSYVFFAYLDDAGFLTPKPTGPALKNEQANTTSKKFIAKPNITSTLQLSKDVTDKLRIALKQAEEYEFTIVMWEPPFDAVSEPWYTDSSQCGKCLVTQNKTMVDDLSTKAVVFHFNEASLNNIPKIRRPDQLYVWWTHESSPSLLELRYLTLTEFDDFFNLTGSHRRDSDIYWPYDSMENIWYHFRQNGPRNPRKEIDMIISNKTGLAVWIVSNCASTSGAVKRRELVHKLVDAGLSVDLRGGCFPESDFVDSDQSIIKNYKFYFAFENGYHCADYITEKLFYNGFIMEAVPVTWGAKKSDYVAVTPPHSFIYADDFPTPSSLVKYLNYLDKNDTAYREYFAWRTKNVTEMPQYGRRTGFCQICRIIHGINVDNAFSPNYEKLKAYIPMFGYPNKSRIVSSLGKWYYETENVGCLSERSSELTIIRKTVAWNYWNHTPALLKYFVAFVSIFAVCFCVTLFWSKTVKTFI